MDQVVWGSIIATKVTLENYLADYAADFHEWIEGTMIKSPSIPKR